MITDEDDLYEFMAEIIEIRKFRCKTLFQQLLNFKQKKTISKNKWLIFEEPFSFKDRRLKENSILRKSYNLTKSRVKYHMMPKTLEVVTRV